MKIAQASKPNRELKHWLNTIKNSYKNDLRMQMIMCEYVRSISNEWRTSIYRRLLGQAC